MAFIIALLLGCVSSVISETCPKQCDCDMDQGLNRAMCVDQNIISIDVGVPTAVQVYSLTHNVISELDNYCFKVSGYTSLQMLDLSYNLIFWIGLHAFAGLDKLVHLDLSNNRLRFIPSDLFWDTPELNTLDISSNIFEKLKNEPFIMHNNLQILNLNNCRMKSLPDRLFTRLPKLKKLDLSENYVITLSAELLRPLSRLERLEIKNDFLNCNSDFIALEKWILSRGITYEQQCTTKFSKMSEKMISVVVPREEVELDKVWNISKTENITKELQKPKVPLTPLQKFDRDFSALQSFVIGLEIGLAIGIVGTYIWLRKFCKCNRLNCIRPETRRQRRRIHRTEGDMRTNLLWNSVGNPDLETPPFFRRQLSLPDRSPPYGVPGIADSGLQVDAIRLPGRSETPPPPYHECRINI